MNKKSIIEIITVIVIIALGVGGYFYWQKTKQTPEEKTLQTVGEATDILQESATQGTLPSIDSGQINPLKDNPDVNPVNKTNPFTNIKTNPFAE